tara:strand:- start:104 stop:526 length:423 start_codon:yes stop_codon:yes gene_type:complete
MKFNVSSKNILVGLLLLFIMFDIHPPSFVSQMLNTIFGKIALFGLVVSLYSQGSLVGSLALVAAYMLLTRSNTIMPVDTRQFVPTQKKKDEFFEKTLNNHFPKTLEEEMIHNMVPLVNEEPIIDSPFIPVTEPSYDAERV